jgi:rhamnosyltransferase
LEDSIKILIVLVIYKSDYNETDAYQSLIRNLTHYPAKYRIGLFIYDNSPLINTKSFQIHGVNQVYQHDSSNPGVSKAYNQGYEYAKHNGYNWLILMDQDTVLNNDGLDNYIHSIKAFPDILIHAPILKSGDLIISPSKYQFRRGFILKDIKPGVHSLGKKAPLNSGMCLNIKVFNEIGLYNEKIRLDFSDFDFIRRISKKIKQFVLMPVNYRHSLSSENETLESSIIRYKFYCDGAYYSVLNFNDIWMLGLVAFMRGIKLAVKFKKGIFLRIFYNHYILRKKG